MNITLCTYVSTAGCRKPQFLPPPRPTENCQVLTHFYKSFFSISEICLVQPDPGLYSFINQGVLTVDGIDDDEEMKNTDVIKFNFKKKRNLKSNIYVTLQYS